MTTASYVQKGDTIDFVAAANHIAGDVATVGTLIGVVVRDVPAGGLGALSLTGVYRLPKSAALAVTAGMFLYWDAENSVVTGTAGSLPLIGQAIESISADDEITSVKVRLTQAAAPNETAAIASAVSDAIAAHEADATAHDTEIAAAVTSGISTHDTSETSHADIRALVAG